MIMKSSKSVTLYNLALPVVLLLITFLLVLSMLTSYMGTAKYIDTGTVLGSTQSNK
jgi:hypothetical protein